MSLFDHTFVWEPQKLVVELVGRSGYEYWLGGALSPVVIREVAQARLLLFLNSIKRKMLKSTYWTVIKVKKVY